MKTETIPMIPTGYISPDNRTEYRAPDSHNGIEITRAIGRMCSGDTILPIPGSPTPQIVIEPRMSDGHPFFICSDMLTFSANRDRRVAPQPNFEAAEKAYRQALGRLPGQGISIA